MLYNKTGLTSTSTKVTLVKGLPYSWNITSRATVEHNYC